MLMFICLHPGVGDVSDFVSSVEHKRKIFNSNCCSHIIAVNGSHGFESKKTCTNKTKLNPVSRDDTLRSKDMNNCARN